MNVNKTFKVELEEDTIYVEATDITAADDKVRSRLRIPDYVPLIIAEARVLPDDEALFAL